MKPSDVNEAAARLKRIEQLWEQLRHEHRHTPAYNALVDRIRAETDAFRQILDAQKGTGGLDPQD